MDGVDKLGQSFRLGTWTTVAEPLNVFRKNWALMELK